MKVCFLVDNLYSPRYGIQLLSSELKARGFAVQLYAYSEPGFIENIQTDKPDVIAYSCMSGEYNLLFEINKRLKEKISFLSVWGGPHPTFFTDIIFHENIDAICTGEGDHVFANMVEKLKNNSDYKTTPNFYFKGDNGQIVKNPHSKLLDIDSLELPDFEIFELEGKELLTVFLSRGCPFNCTYCFNHKWKDIHADDIYSKKLRTMSVPFVRELFIKKIKPIIEKYGMKYVHFDDDVFPYGREWLENFSKMYGAEIGVPFDINLHPLMVKDSNIKLLKKVGLFRVNIAIESGSTAIRKQVLNRNMTNEQILEAAKIIKGNGLLLHTQNITCLPRETWEDTKKTLELNIKCKSDISVVSKFVPYPGTRLASIAMEEGYLSEGFEKILPDNYHWTSILHFKNKKDKQKMEYLVNLFTLCVFYPFLKPLVYFLVTLPPWRILKRIYARIDNQVWILVTQKNYHSQINSKKIKTFFLILFRLIFPESKKRTLKRRLFYLSDESFK
ncbi:MAG: B12-binding domain-containing radical SAM protein [Candidatus Scalinduaceae bacterium]